MNQTQRHNLHEMNKATIANQIVPEYLEKMGWEEYSSQEVSILNVVDEPFV